MYNASLFREIMGNTVILVYEDFSASVCSSGNGRLTFPPADYLNTAMVDRYNIISFRAAYLDFTGRYTPHFGVCLPVKYTRGRA